MQLVLDSDGIELKKQNACFFIQNQQHERLISPEKITSIALTKNVMIATSAIRLAIQHKIPIYLMDAFGNVEARLWSASFGHLSTFRRKQVLAYDDPIATQWVIGLFEHKTAHQLENLAFLKNRKIAQIPLIDENIKQIEVIRADFGVFENKKLAAITAELMGKEGIMARFYWESLAACMSGNLCFENRNRKPPQDHFNAALNYFYGMLYGMVETAIFSVGLDPYLGFLHADQYDKPTLSFDMIEPFRPWADRLLIEMALHDELPVECFEQSPQKDGIWLSRKGKEVVIPAFIKFFDEKAIFEHKVETRKNHIYRFAFELVKILDQFDPNQ